MRRRPRIRVLRRTLVTLSAAVMAAAACSNARIPAAPGDSSGAAHTLPLREMPVKRDTGGAVFAVVLTGDGPVRGLGDRLGASLARAGVPAAVWSSLRYYWRPRTPEQAAADLDRVIRHYAARWGRGRVVLVGYSMGADVLPFLVNRLPADTRARIDGVALLALAHDAAFEFRVEQWWTSTQAPTRATRPEVERLAPLRVLCVYGRGDPKTACPEMRSASVTVVELKGGHHFTGDHRRLKRLMIELARASE